MLLVPLQYFLGIVCFLSKTLLTNNGPICLKTRGHISIWFEHSPSWLLPSAPWDAELKFLFSHASRYLSRVEKHKREGAPLTEVHSTMFFTVKQAVYSWHCWVMLFELFKAYILVWTKWRLKHALENALITAFYVQYWTKEFIHFLLHYFEYCLFILIKL